MESNFIDLEGKKIHYKSNLSSKLNSKPICIFIHGASTTSQHTEFWLPLYPIIEKYSQPIFIDGYGHGISSNPEPNELINFDIHLKIYSDVLRFLIQEKKINSFTLIGRSLGGNIVHTLSNKYEQYLTGIGLIAPSGSRNASKTLYSWKKKISVLWDSRDPVVAFSAYSEILNVVNHVKLFVIGDDIELKSGKKLKRKKNKSPTHTPELLYPELFEEFLISLLT